MLTCLKIFSLQNQVENLKQDEHCATVFRTKNPSHGLQAVSVSDKANHHFQSGRYSPFIVSLASYLRTSVSSSK